MNVQEASEIITNAIQSDGMTAAQDEALAIAQKALEKQMPKKGIMKERNNYMLCCSCGYAVKDKNIFKKAYQNTAICLCRKCAKELVKDIENWSDTK